VVRGRGRKTARLPDCGNPSEERGTGREKARRPSHHGLLVPTPTPGSETGGEAGYRGSATLPTPVTYTGRYPQPGSAEGGIVHELVNADNVVEGQPVCKKNHRNNDHTNIDTGFMSASLLAAPIHPSLTGTW
jgi:hypothetical protein